MPGKGRWYRLPGKVYPWVPGFFTLFAAVILFQLLASTINTIYVKKATGKLAVTANASFMDHVLRMPMEFFSQRRTGDLSQRVTANDSVASTLVNQLSPTISVVEQASPVTGARHFGGGVGSNRLNYEYPISLLAHLVVK